MEESERDLLALYERDADRLLELALRCTDRRVRQKLMDWGAEYIEELDRAPGEKTRRRPKVTFH